VFAVFGGGVMLAANTLHHSAPPVSSAVAPAPSATADTPADHAHHYTADQRH